MMEGKREERGEERSREVDWRGTVVCPFPGFFFSRNKSEFTSLPFESVEPHVLPRHYQISCGRQTNTATTVNRLCISCISSIHHQIDIQKNTPLNPIYRIPPP